MSAYDLEEQERIAALKDWWEKWGKLVIAALVAFVVGVAGTAAWRSYQAKQAKEAETLFAEFQTVAKDATIAKDWKKVTAAATALSDKYPATFYASDAQLIAAKASFEGGDLPQARTHLEWVVNKGRDAHRNVARVRLAAVFLDEKKYDDALKTLDAVKEEAFVSMAADLKGDIFAAQGKRDEARSAYEMAVDKADERSPLKAISQAKLDAFGGKTEKPADVKTDAKSDAKAEDKKDAKADAAGAKK
jgi:predicted negative regulator of RcsB-dependent stress response